MFFPQASDLQTRFDSSRAVDVFFVFVRIKQNIMFGKINFYFTGRAKTISPAAKRKFSKTANEKFAAERRFLGRRQPRRRRAGSHRVRHREVFDQQTKFPRKFGRHEVESSIVDDRGKACPGVAARFAVEFSKRRFARRKADHRRRRVRPSSEVVVRRLAHPEAIVQERGHG